MVNTHHLELFYYVARHGGIVKACRHIPYGIQQPAVSSQLISLEKSLGVRLFERKPFLLTPAGKRIFELISPFFSGIRDIRELITNDLRAQIRITGASEFLREHLPPLFTKIKTQFPDIRLYTFDRNQADSLTLIEKGEADLAITVIEKNLPRHISCQEIIKLSPVLITHERLGISHWSELKKMPLDQKPPLIALPPDEMLTRSFLEHLEGLGVKWPVSIEVSSHAQIIDYARHKLGIGLVAKLPSMELPSSLRLLELKEFPTLSIAAFWRHELSPPAQSLLSELLSKAHQHKKKA